MTMYVLSWLVDGKIIVHASTEPFFFFDKYKQRQTNTKAITTSRLISDVIMKWDTHATTFISNEYHN